MNEKSSSGFLIFTATIAGFVLLVGAGIFLYSKDDKSFDVKPASEDSSATANSPKTKESLVSKDRIIAYVDDTAIYEGEITPLLGTMARPIAIDTYINKLLTAKATLADPKLKEEADKKLRFVQNDILSNFYFERMGARVVGAVSDAELQDYYNKNISDDLFAKYSVSYGIYNDAQEAENVSNTLKKGEDLTAAKAFKPFMDNTGKESSFTVTQFPYNLGRIVEQLKPGEFSPALATRDGFFVLRLDKKNPGKKPELSEIRNQILQTISMQKMNENVAALRSAAKIVLK